MLVLGSKEIGSFLISICFVLFLVNSKPFVRLLYSSCLYLSVCVYVCVFFFFFLSSSCDIWILTVWIEWYQKVKMKRKKIPMWRPGWWDLSMILL